MTDQMQELEKLRTDRPFRKFTEHLEDALIHSESIGKLSAIQKKEINNLISKAYEIAAKAQI